MGPKTATHYYVYDQEPWYEMLGGFLGFLMTAIIFLAVLKTIKFW